MPFWAYWLVRDAHPAMSCWLENPTAGDKASQSGQEDFHIKNTIRALVKIRRSNFQQFSTTKKNKNSYYYQLFADEPFISWLS
jgi:hypothetical protein